MHTFIQHGCVQLKKGTVNTFRSLLSF